MKASFLLHLYQPSTIDINVLHKVCKECYLPLIKFLKQKKNLCFTLNIPLSLLELMEKNGYSYWIQDLRDLLNSEQIKITGSAAYHPILTKIPDEQILNQIILNEYALGYYLGSKQNFEGDPMLQIKDLDGFFSPEMSINENIVKILSDLSYKWVVCDSVAFNVNMGFSKIFKLKDFNTLLINRDRNLSNMLAFKRDLNMFDINSYINTAQDDDYSLISVDAETFGHHFTDGFFLLDYIVDEITNRGGELIFVDDAVTYYKSENIKEIIESSWGAGDEDMKNGDPYPFWYMKNSSIHNKLEVIEKEMMQIDLPVESDDLGLETSPIWKDEISKEITIKMLVSKFLQSDKYWWSSKKNVIEAYLFDSGMVLNALEYADKTAELVGNPTIKSISEEIRQELKK